MTKNCNIFVQRFNGSAWEDVDTREVMKEKGWTDLYGFEYSGLHKPPYERVDVQAGEFLNLDIIPPEDLCRYQVFCVLLDENLRAIHIRYDRPEDPPRLNDDGSEKGKWETFIDIIKEGITREFGEDKQQSNAYDGIFNEYKGGV